MEKLQISMVKILLPIFFVALLFVTPFLSTSVRSSYILNLLILFLGLEAGFLSPTSKSLDESKKHYIFNTNIEATHTTTSQGNITKASVQPQIVLVNQISKQEMATKKEAIKCRPSIFFIGSDHEPEIEIDSVEMNEEEIIVEGMEAKTIPMKRVGKVEKMSKHELYMMTETFIGNLYKQLKVEEEVESSRKLVA